MPSSKGRSDLPQYLEVNLKQWSPEVQAVILSNKYKLITDADSGLVTIIGAGGKKIGTVLAWTQFEDESWGKAYSGGTTVPTLPGAKLVHYKKQLETRF